VESAAAAVREAIINAAVHADYSSAARRFAWRSSTTVWKSRIPALLPFGITVQDMRDGVSRLRNRVIGRVFQELGYIEQWGSGIKRMSAACRDAGIEERVWRKSVHVSV